MVAYVYAADWKAERPDIHLGDFAGILQVDGYGVLFAGSDEGGDNWAVIAALIENCKLGGINPHDWLTGP